MEAILLFKSITYWPFHQNWFHLFTIYAHLNTLNLVYSSLAISIRSHKPKRLFQFYASKFPSISDILLNLFIKIYQIIGRITKLYSSRLLSKTFRSLLYSENSKTSFLYRKSCDSMNTIHSVDEALDLFGYLGVITYIFLPVLMLIDLSFRKKNSLFLDDPIENVAFSFPCKFYSNRNAFVFRTRTIILFNMEQSFIISFFAFYYSLINGDDDRISILI